MPVSPLSLPPLLTGSAFSAKRALCCAGRNIELSLRSWRAGTTRRGRSSSLQPGFTSGGAASAPMARMGPRAWPRRRPPHLPSDPGPTPPTQHLHPTPSVRPPLPESRTLPHSRRPRKLSHITALSYLGSGPTQDWLLPSLLPQSTPIPHFHAHRVPPARPVDSFRACWPRRVRRIPRGPLPGAARQRQATQKRWLGVQVSVARRSTRSSRDSLRKQRRKEPRSRANHSSRFRNGHSRNSRRNRTRSSPCRATGCQSSRCSWGSAPSLW